MRLFVSWMERNQIALYLGAILLGIGLGFAIPGSRYLEYAIEPVIALLLFATFLAVPFRRIGAAVRDIRFLVTIGVLNFVVVPVVAFVLSRFVASNEAMLIGVLLVLLTPCIDYVIVFSGLAGGAKDRLLAATPLLMLAQLLLLPIYLLLFMGPSALGVIEVGPFVRAFLILIVVPLGAAVIVPLLSARFAPVRRAERFVEALMVPLMIATLAVVVASQIAGVGLQIGVLIGLVPLYAAFVVIMIGLGILTSRIARLEVPASRALTFSGVTRNSLVVLPLALALPASLSLAPLVIVTQTLVELVAMVILVRLLPKLIPAGTGSVAN